MSREIAQRIYIKGVLVTQSPLHVGGMSLDPTIDLTLAVDGQGRLYIPGTSLAGALRNYVNSDDLWGCPEKEKGHASFMVIEDTFLADESVVFTEVRDGVQIDRQWGSAAKKGKFDRAIIPKGVELYIKMSLDIPCQDESYVARLDQILGALVAGEIRLGAAKTRGLGRVKLKNCQKLVHTLNTKKGILAALCSSPSSSEAYENYDLPNVVASNYIQVTIDWKPVGAVMVKDAIEGNALDILPLTSADGNELSMTIPGSSIKGAFRSQAERIIRTLCPGIETSDNFLQAIQVPIVQDLFGAAASKNEKQLGQSALSVEDCSSKQRFTHEAWQNIVQAPKDSDLSGVLSNADLASAHQAFHVAIDRWTGGAAEHMLYTNLEPFGVNWSPIELRVNLLRLARNPLAGIALLLLLLRDFCKQRIPLGYGVNRGLGTIDVQKITIEGEGLISDSSPFSWLIDPKDSFQGIPPELLTLIDAAWQSAISQIKNPQSEQTHE
jgi:CRISPR/Cas system CSM-associated protein Csm3 (group 7 of RAMP superfamily)